MTTPSVQPDDIITLGGEEKRVIDSFIAEKPAQKKDGTPYVLRCGVLIVEPA